MGKDSLDKFSGVGFHTWQTKVKGYLMKKNLWNVVNPAQASVESSVTRALSAQQQQRDEQAFGIIITALDDSFIHYIDGVDTATEAWTLLERVFGARAKHSKISLKMQLYGLKLESNELVASLINRMKSLCTQLVYIQAPVDEEDQVAVLLKALPSDYGQIVTVLKEKDPVPRLEDVINSLQEEERKLGKDPVVPSVIKGEAYVTTSSQKGCFECGKTNHQAKDCWKTNPCCHCGGTNHPSNRCYHKTKDKDLRQGKEHNKRGGQVNVVTVEPMTHDGYESTDDIL